MGCGGGWLLGFAETCVWGGQVDLTVRNAAEAPGRSRRLGAHDAADGLPQMNTRALYLLLLRYL